MSSSKAQGPTSRRRSCDLCRKKKIRCDGPYNSEPSCSYCRTRRLLCKYDDIPRKITTKVSGSLSLQTTSAVSVATTPTNGADEAKLSEEDMDHFCGTSVTHLVDKLSNVHLDEHPGFYGTSSTATFIQAARRSINPLAQQKMKDMRPYFWTAREWEANSTVLPEREFPPMDLAISLIDLYFNHLNIYYPLLHRPTFEEAWRTGRQSTDLGFAYTSLLVFANAARLSHDRRVYAETEDENSAGWKWFNQVSLSSRRPMLAPATLFDLQIYALSAIFLLSSSSGQTCWEIAGSGVRMGQSVGAHKKRRWTSDGHPSAQDELWKKAFWVLVVLDNNLSASFGRQTAIQDEDITLDLLYECDDEFWDLPDAETSWRQPAGLPALATAFNKHIGLCRIVNRIRRTVYTPRTLTLSTPEAWENLGVTDLDSLLNEWLDRLPKHLLLDLNSTKDTHFYRQSAGLHAAFRDTQILVHRLFLFSPATAPKEMISNSFVICSNAAKGVAKLVQTCGKPRVCPPIIIQIHTLKSAITLLITALRARAGGLPSTFEVELGSLAVCMDYFQQNQSRWISTGKLWDIVHDLVVSAQISLPHRNRDPSDSQDDNRILTSASLRMPWGNQSTFHWDPSEPPTVSQSPSPNSSHDPFMAVEADWLMSLDFFGPNAFQSGLEHPALFEGQVGNMIDITPASFLYNQPGVTNVLASINE